MTDNAVTSAAPVAPVVAKSPVKKKAVASKSKKAPASHPSTAVMVTAAVKQLKEKKGSSLVAIKKYLTANYKVDASKLAPFIRKFLKAAVTKGVLVQTKGTGATGLFKLAAEAKKPAKKAVAASKKPAAKKPKSAKATGTPKKRKAPVAKATKSEPAAKKAKKVTGPAKPKKTVAKSPAKTKKTPAAKPKPPKAKKLQVKKTAAPKKK